METPPQAWGRLWKRLVRTSRCRNTPTGVGKTRVPPGLSTRQQKHPHRRGEDRLRGSHVLPCPETPPQAWGRLTSYPSCPCCRGNTPTGVGKTRPARVQPRGESKHPHRRGEDKASGWIIWRSRETPPQAWGRLQEELADAVIRRNTPTGVGKTSCASLIQKPVKKHPHRRGEDPGPVSPPQMTQETPPQAWGRPTGLMVMSAHSRNTPTGVGKTNRIDGNVGPFEKHPHRRGEDWPSLVSAALSRETPPQAWGRPLVLAPSVLDSGNTPTGVGKTQRWPSVSAFF